MSHPHCFHCPPADPIYTDPQVVVQDFYYPQIVPIVHTVQVVRRHHCVPVPKHFYNYLETDKDCTVSGKSSAKISRHRR